MTDVGVIVDCSAPDGDGVSVRALSEDETANLARIAEETAAARAGRDAAAADRAAGIKQLKTQARAGGKVDAAVLARLMGVDVNAPDPAQSAAG
jgi:hypothetical protein